MTPDDSIPQGEKRSSRIQVLEAVHALYDQDLEITRSALVRQTGLKTVTVDDCIKELKRRDEIWSPEDGVYRPKVRYEPSQPVSVTILPTGHVKLEKGDQVMEFNPFEWRQQVAPVAAGSCAQAAVIEHTHQTIQLVDQVRRLRRKVEALEAKMKVNPAQGDLLGALA